MADVVKAEQNLPVPLDYSQYAGQGTEQATAGDYALPFLMILQKLSPQVDETTIAYVKNAKAGMVFESATGQIWDGKEGVRLIPCYFRKDMVEWAPREAGGGFVKAHGWNEELMGQCTRDERGRMILPNGNLLVDTKYHYCLLLTEQGPMQVVLSMTSTQLKKSRKWLSMINMRRMTDKQGKSFIPPSFAYTYKLTTGQESNEKGTWFGWQVEMGEAVVNPDVARQAVQFMRLVKEGNVKVADPDAGMKDDIPF